MGMGRERKVMESYEIIICTSKHLISGLCYMTGASFNVLNRMEERVRKGPKLPGVRYEIHKFLELF